MERRDKTQTIRWCSAWTPFGPSKLLDVRLIAGVASSVSKSAVVQSSSVLRPRLPEEIIMID